ncbi:hypothetical protein Bca101_093538 [Brassica carinata]
MESTGKSPVSSYRKPKRKILSSSAISKTPTGKSVAASEIAIKPNGKTAVSSAIPRSQSSSAHGDDVMFFRDVTMRPHQEELRFRLIHFWEARNPNTKTLTGVEMLLIDEQDSPVPFQEDWFRFRSHEEFEANCDLKKRQPNQFSSSKPSKTDSSSPSSFSYEKYRSTGKAPAALFFDDTSGLNKSICSFRLLIHATSSDKWRRLCLSLFPFLQAPNSIAFGSHNNIKIWWKWLTIGYAYLGYIIEDPTTPRLALF